MAKPDHVKIRVVMNIPDGPQSEGLWAIPTDKPDHYEVNNIPYYAYGINAHDIVRCTAPPERRVLEVIKPSGHRTLRIMFQPNTKTSVMNGVVMSLVQKGGHPDLGFPGFLSLDVAPHNDYDQIFTYLKDLNDQGLLKFESAEQQVEGSFGPKQE